MPLYILLLHKNNSSAQGLLALLSPIPSRRHLQQQQLVPIKPAICLHGVPVTLPGTKWRLLYFKCWKALLVENNNCSVAPCDGVRPEWKHNLTDVKGARLLLLQHLLLLLLSSWSQEISHLARFLLMSLFTTKPKDTFWNLLSRKKIFFSCFYKWVFIRV